MHRRPPAPTLVSFVAMSALAAALPAQAVSRARVPDRPSLIVFITVDQMRADYLDRWSGQLTGGMARLRDHGAVFTNAWQDHAVTETAPGHSVTMAGRFPRSTGIVRNTAGVEDAQAPLLTSRDAPASPYRFRGSVLIDWLRARDARSRALSVSRKDRGAILPLGRAKQSVYWYATSIGEWTTSRYYGDTLPAWLRAVNARRLPQRMAGEAWTLLLPASAYAEADSQPVENNGRSVVFPHSLPPDSLRAAAELPYTPWMDEQTAAVALEGLEAMGLGAGSATDILAVSFSASDYIGHRYGPDSREVHDNFLRLDRTLGAFIDSLYRLRDSSSIAFALTADHGVTAYPEITARRMRRTALLSHDVRPAVATMRASLRERGVDTTLISLEGSLVHVQRDRLIAEGVDPDPILRRFIRDLRATPGIARVDAVRGMAHRDTIHDPVNRRWVHMLPPDVPVEYVFTPVEGAYPAGAEIAEHGAPYDDDAHVPLVFYGPWFRPGRYAERALVVDMAPTLARIAGVLPTEPLDGRVLARALVVPTR